MIRSFLPLLFKVAVPVLTAFRGLTGGRNVGACVLVENENGEVLLVRHTYRSGWYFPGGGTKRGEHPAETAVRELYEETGLKLVTPPELKGVFLNRICGLDDYVFFYQARNWTGEAFPAARLEIAEVGWFLPTVLPPDTAFSVRRQLGQAPLPKEGRW